MAFEIWFDYSCKTLLENLYIYDKVQKLGKNYMHDDLNENDL